MRHMHIYVLYIGCILLQEPQGALLFVAYWMQFVFSILPFKSHVSNSTKGFIGEPFETCLRIMSRCLFKF